jgi:hypothetical protein
LASADDFAARPACCRKPPGALYIGNGTLADAMHLAHSVAEVIRTRSPKLYGRMAVAPPPPGDPVSIPHDVENREVGTGIDQELNPQVSGPSRVRPSSRIGSAQPLKVETRVRIRLGLPGKRAGQGHDSRVPPRSRELPIGQ